MSKFIPDEAQSSKLKDKVVVLTGGAQGIGAATVRQLHDAGAYVVFGDIDSSKGEEVTSSLSPDRVTFVQTDVTNYGDNVNLFKIARQKYGHVDHAVAVAGIIEQGRWFDPELTVETVEKPETEMVIKVNLLGTAYFTRIAVVYLRDGKKEGEDKSLTLISSAAGFRESPGLWMYQCSKHGIQGLMRTLRKVIYPRDGVRVNTVNPGLVDTRMTSNIIASFRETKQAICTPEDVAKVILGIQLKDDMNGRGVYVEGGRGWEFEEGLDRTMPQWLGEEPTQRLRDALKVVGSGSGWGIK